MILDAFSRRVIGWALDRTMEDELTLSALRVALSRRGVSMAEVARGLEISPNVLRRWKKEFRANTGNAFPGNGKQRWSDGKLAELERMIRHLYLYRWRTIPVMNLR